MRRVAPCAPVLTLGGVNRFSTYLFDLDGTLLDTIDLISYCYRRTLETHRGVTYPDSTWLEKLGMPLQKQLEVFSSDQAEIDAMRATYRGFFLERHDAMVREYPGAREAVGKLKDRGVKLGVVTSKMRPGTLRGLTAGGFDGVFDVLVTVEDVAEHKPHPAPVTRALELLDSRPEEALFIGDSPHDMASGRAAGVSTAAALWGPFPRQALEPHAPTFWLAEPGEMALV